MTGANLPAGTRHVSRLTLNPIPSVFHQGVIVTGALVAVLVTVVLVIS